MITVERKLDHARKIEIVTMTDKFGAQYVLQHPLLSPAYDKEAEEKKVVELMDANELAWEKVIAPVSE